MKKKRFFPYVLLWLGVLFLVSVAVSGCTRVHGKRTVSPADGARQEAEAVLRGVVTKNDTATELLTFRGLDSDNEMVMAYDATAEITDRFGSERDGEEIEAGEILEVTYDAYQGMIKSAMVPKEAWEYQEVDRYSVDSDEQSMEFAERKYHYLDTTYFGSGGRAIELMELNKRDLLTIRGIGYTVYSVVRTKGHGYIRLKHYEDFIGGMIEIGDGQILAVAKNMLITVRAGTYKVIISKGRAVAVKNATVRTDEEVTLDFSDYEPIDDHIGTITFDIEPAGSDLTLNGTAVNYSRPVALAYGVYQIEVSMTGYTTYSGRLDVEDDSTVRISLVEEEASSDKTTPAPTKKKSKKSSTTTKKMDSGHTITVSAPEGAEVYLDNVYKGLAPCTFTKVIGTQTVTLSKAGYVTKSYSVDILDDGKDTKLSFGELVASDEFVSTSSTPAPAVSADVSD